jgi:hypothetical protein
MTHNLFDEQLGELHRQDLIAHAASAHLRQHVDRERPRVRLAAVAAWLSRHLGGHVRVRRVPPAAPSSIETSLNIH